MLVPRSQESEANANSHKLSFAISTHVGQHPDAAEATAVCLTAPCVQYTWSFAQSGQLVSAAPDGFLQCPVSLHLAHLLHE